MRIFLISIVIVISSTTFVIAQDFIPGEVVVSFRDKTIEIFDLSKTGTKSIYPELDDYLSIKKIQEIREIYHGPKGVRNIFVFRFSTDFRKAVTVTAI